MNEGPCFECYGWHKVGRCPHALDGWILGMFAVAVAAVLVLR